MSIAKDQLYIDAPALLTARQKARDTLVTAAMWMFYLYLWVPLISLCAWLLGFEFAYDVMIRAGGARELGNVLIFYAIIVAVIFCVVTAWSISNLLRFGRLHRRRAIPSVSLDEMAEYFDFDAEFVRQLRAHKTLLVSFDKEGRPLLEEPDLVQESEDFRPGARFQ